MEKGLYIGSAVDKPPAGTKAVVNLCGREDTFQMEASLWEPVFEGGQEPNLQWLRRVVEFIAAQRAAGRPTYVHCLAGMNRSGAVVVAYLMQEHGWGRDEALAYLQKRRPVVQPNPTLMRLLAEWEEAMNTNSDDWNRIHAWLAVKAPKIVANLNVGATEPEIEAAEHAIGHVMPEDWRQLYRAHNGMNDQQNLGSLFFGMQFLSLEEVRRERENRTTSEGERIPVQVADAGVRKDDIYNPKWITFASDRGDTLLLIDLDPAPEGVCGQVIFADHAHDTVIVLSKSLNQLLADFAEDLENGRYVLDPEALEDGNEFLSPEKDIDVVNWSFSPRWKHLAR